MTLVPRFLAATLALIPLLASCREDDGKGRLVLRAEAAGRLGLRETVFAEIDSSRVPASAREKPARMRDQLGGGRRAVRFYSSPGGEIAILVPTRSVEGEDPHVVMGMRAGADRPATTILHSYEAVQSYCPAEGAMGEDALAVDSTDGCRYVRPVPVPEAVPAP